MRKRSISGCGRRDSDPHRCINIAPKTHARSNLATLSLDPTPTPTTALQNTFHSLHAAQLSLQPALRLLETRAAATVIIGVAFSQCGTPGTGRTDRPGARIPSTGGILRVRTGEAIPERQVRHRVLIEMLRWDCATLFVHRGLLDSQRTYIQQQSTNR